MFVFTLKSLDPSSLEITGLNDDSFAKNRDFISQLEYIIFVRDTTDSAISTLYK